jgi:hypothetical protein
MFLKLRIKELLAITTILFLKKNSVITYLAPGPKKHEQLVKGVYVFEFF